MDYRRNRDLIALPEKARHRHANHDVLADDHFLDRASDLAIRSDAAGGCAPCGQRVREIEFH